MRRPEPLLFLALLAAAAPARGADPPPEQRLESVQRSLDQGRQESETLAQRADALKAELGQLQDQAVASARIAQDNEARLTQLDHDLKALDADRTAQQAALDAGAAREAQVLAALERLAVSPPAAMVFAPGSPIDAARGGMLLGAAVPRLEDDARAYAASLERLRATRAEIDAKRIEMTEHQTALDAEHQRIALLMQQKQALAGQTAAQTQENQKHLAALSAEAGDLKQLIDRLDQARQQRLEDERKQAADAQKRLAAGARHDAAPAQVAAIAPARPAPPGGHGEAGRLLIPVAGEIVKHFGDTDGFGTSKGLTFQTRPGAEIVSPVDGEIMFAGPFKGYGQILIIDQGGGYHSLLAGIDRIGATVGQHVAAGEPIGTMASDGAPNLYLELRRQDQPINPLPWLVARDGKVSG